MKPGFKPALCKELRFSCKMHAARVHRSVMQAGFYVSQLDISTSSSPGPRRPLGDHTPRHTLRAAGSQLQVSVQPTNLPTINKDNLCCVSPLPKYVTRSHFGSKTTRPASLIFHENLTFLFSPVPVRWQTCKKIYYNIIIYTGVHVWMRERIDRSDSPRPSLLPLESFVSEWKASLQYLRVRIGGDFCSAGG